MLNCFKTFMELAQEVEAISLICRQVLNVRVKRKRGLKGKEH